MQLDEAEAAHLLKQRDWEAAERMAVAVEPFGLDDALAVALLAGPPVLRQRVQHALFVLRHIHWSLVRQGRGAPA